MRKSKLKEIFGDLFEEDIKNAAEKTTVKINERVAADMLKNGESIEKIKLYSRLSLDSILNLAKSLGVTVVM